MLHHLDEALLWIWLLINSHIISMRDKQGGVELIRADWTCFACELTRLPTGDQSIIATQVHKPSTVTHRTSRPAREHSFCPFCHLLAAAMNPSSCLPPTGFFATHQMALLVWGTFTLSGSMWLFYPLIANRCIPWGWPRGSVVGAGISQQDVTTATCEVDLKTCHSDVSYVPLGLYMTLKHPLIMCVLEIVYMFMWSTSSCDQLSAI